MTTILDIATELCRLTKEGIVIWEKTHNDYGWYSTKVGENQYSMNFQQVRSVNFELARFKENERPQLVFDLYENFCGCYPIFEELAIQIMLQVNTNNNGKTLATILQQLKELEQ